MKHDLNSALACSCVLKDLSYLRTLHEIFSFKQSHFMLCDIFNNTFQKYFQRVLSEPNSSTSKNQENPCRNLSRPNKNSSSKFPAPIQILYFPSLVHNNQMPEVCAGGRRERGGGRNEGWTLLIGTFVHVYKGVCVCHCYSLPYIFCGIVKLTKEQNCCQRKLKNLRR